MQAGLLLSSVSQSDPQVIADPGSIAAIEGDGSLFRVVTLALDFTNTASGELRRVLVGTFTLTYNGALFTVIVGEPSPTSWSSGFWTETVRVAMTELAEAVVGVYRLAV